VPKVRECSGRWADLSTATMRGWRGGGSSQGTSRRGGVGSMGTAGRFSRGRSLPHPGMWANCGGGLPVWGVPGSGVVWSMGSSSGASGFRAGGRGDQHRLDAVVALIDEDVVGIGDVFQRHAVGDDFARGDVAGADVLDELRQVALHAGLVAAQGEPLVD